jgi:hypothetical protein
MRVAAHGAQGWRDCGVELHDARRKFDAALERVIAR